MTRLARLRSTGRASVSGPMADGRQALIRIPRGPHPAQGLLDVGPAEPIRYAAAEASRTLPVERSTCSAACAIASMLPARLVTPREAVCIEADMPWVTADCSSTAEAIAAAT